MHYHNHSIGFSFDLPDDWREEKSVATVTFCGPNARVGVISEVIELRLGPIAQGYAEPDVREQFLDEPGAKVSRTIIGGERNTIVLEKAQNCELSIVRDGIQYSFSYAKDSATKVAMECMGASMRFPSPDDAGAAIRKWCDEVNQTRCVRCDRRINLLSTGERSVFGVNMAMHEKPKGDFTLVFECTKCGAMYCWVCAEYKPAIPPSKVFDYALRCDCRSTQFIPIPARPWS